RFPSDRAKLKFLSLTVGLQVAILFSFKFLQNTPSPFGLPLTPIKGYEIAIPLGLSYYTFKLISYLADIYFGRIKPEKNFTVFACYTAFFPQIVAGPIQRGVTLLPQIEKAPTPKPDDIVSGFRLILFGIFKKIVVAEGLTFH